MARLLFILKTVFLKTKLSNMKSLILILSICFFTEIAIAQENLDQTIITNSEIIKDNRIDSLRKTYQATYQLKGYRVQIYSGNKKQPANQSKAAFSRIHPKTKAHLDYDQPYYKVRVGDFKTKLEALKYKNFIIQAFPNSFIVKDEIEINGTTIK